MAHPHGYPAGQRAWARARLTRGSSAGEVWEIGSEYPEARLTVGADPAAGWAIQAPGVHPVHCELFWDGQSLWVADTHAVGGVFLDGQRVTEWVQISGPAELRFGQAALDVETSTPMHQQMISSPRHARPVTVTDLVAPPDDARPSTPIFGGAAGDESIPDLEAAATRVVASPLPELESDRTRVAAPAQAAPPSADLRPRLGGSGAPVAAEATRMVAMPAQAPAKPPAPPLSPSAVIAPPPAPPAAPAFGQPPPLSAPPAAPAAGMPPAGANASHDPSMLPAVSGAPAFAAPPPAPQVAPTKSPFAQILEKLKPQSSAEVVQAGGGKLSQVLPIRTWIMLGVTVAAAVALLLWDTEPEVAAPPRAQADAPVAPQAAEAPAAGPTAAEPAAPPTPAVADTAVEPQPEGPSPAPAVGSQQSSGEGEDGDEEEGPTLQRQAIDLYLTGRYPDALALYRQLAAANPNDASYAAMVRILEERVQCHNGVGPGGQPCAAP